LEQDNEDLNIKLKSLKNMNAKAIDLIEENNRLCDIISKKDSDLKIKDQTISELSLEVRQNLDKNRSLHSNNDEKERKYQQIMNKIGSL
jgi:hypothetical protein